MVKGMGGGGDFIFILSVFLILYTGEDGLISADPVLLLPKVQYVPGKSRTFFFYFSTQSGFHPPHPPCLWEPGDKRHFFYCNMR
jgi:hypothetical protein